MNKKTPYADELLNIARENPLPETDIYFYTRLRARMEKTLLNDAGWNFSLRSLLLIGALTMLLLMNGFFLMNEEKSRSVTTESGLQTFASSYDLTITTLY